GRLITNCRRHTPQQSGYFRTCQRITEDVVDEQQHIPTFIAEIFSHCEASKRDTQAYTRRLIHLTKRHRQFIQHTSFFHFVVQRRTLTGALTYPSENRKTRVLSSDG